MQNVAPRIREIYCQLLECESDADRNSYLDSACGDDVALRNQVQELLDAQRSVGEFLGGTAKLEAGDLTSIGSSIGPYKLREKIGEGGFGVVYVAEQKQPVRRKVALKLIKPGMDSKDIIARFEAERQALAMMDHPNVAKVLDAGSTEDGRPYFVMELVHGVSITEFCDQQKLTNRKRLDLFIDVCSAVQHAHQKGIIHRDLKPSNVMVTTSGDRMIPKVIDFGVAKALYQDLTEKSIYTAYGQLIGTPMYMSPEQAELSSLDVDTRSDIYSLGVLLYELLTGSTPFDKETFKKAGFDEIRRMIREDDPRRPSDRVSTLRAELQSTISEKRNIDRGALSRSLRGELDWIVMKALDKDRARRYETANEFASDIERYLKDEPVSAGPPSAAYRFRKFARRNSGMLIAASTIGVLLALGIAGTSWQMFRAMKAEEIAKQQASQIKISLDEKTIALDQASKAIERQIAVSDFVLVGLLDAAKPDESGSPDTTVRDALKTVQSKLDDCFSDNPELKAWVQHQLGHHFFIINDFEMAIHHLEEALATQTKLLSPSHLDTLDTAQLLAANYHAVADFQKASDLARETNKISQSTYGKTHAMTAKSLYRVGQVFQSVGKLNDARQALIQVVETSQRLGLEALNADSLNLLGCVYYDMQDLQSAEECFQKAITGYQENNSHPHISVILPMRNLASIYSARGDFEKAKTLQERALANTTSVYGKLDIRTLHATEQLAGTYYYLGNMAEAVRLFSVLECAYREKFGTENLQTAMAMVHFGRLLNEIGEGDNAKAIALLRSSSKIAMRIGGPTNKATRYSLNALGVALLENNELDEARDCFERLANSYRELLESHPNDVEYARGLGGAYNNLATISEECKEYENAVEKLTEAEDVLVKVIQRDQSITTQEFLSNVYDNRANCFRLLAEPQKAIDDFDRAIKLANTELRKAIFKVRRAKAIILQGDHELATKVARAQLDLFPDDPLLHFEAACVFAIAAGASLSESTSSDRQLNLNESLLNQSIDYLDTAKRLGFFKKASVVNDLTTHPDLSAIRDHPMFKRFVENLDVSGQELKEIETNN